VNYAPCSLAELTAKGYDYWALGHVHEHAILQKSPWVVFPGNLQGRHIRETGARGAVLVTADEAGIQSVERVLVDLLRWHVVEVDASQDGTLQEVVRSVGLAFERLLAETPESIYLSVRVCIKGKTAVHGELFGLESQLREDILGQAAGQGTDRLWVEKVRLETQPDVDAVDLATRSDAIADLQKFLDEAPEDAVLLESLLQDLRPLLDRMPLDVIHAVPELHAIRTGDMAGIVKSVTPGLLAYLAKSN